MKITNPGLITRICVRLLFLLLFLCSNGFSGEKTESGTQTELMDLVAPTQLVVQVKDGKGSLSAIYEIKKGLEPAVQITDAIGGSEALNSAGITAVWGKRQEATKETDLLILTITVDTKQLVEPNLEYTAKIIFLSDNFEKHESLAIKDTAELNFNVSPDQLQTVLLSGQSDQREIIVSNTGKRKIAKIDFSSLNLEDTSTHRRIDFNQTEQAVDLEPRQEKTLSFQFPQPFYAGTYVGSLNVTADQRVRKTIAFTIKTRGPNPFGWAWFPFVLFTMVLAAGYFISVLLNNWFEMGGFDRAQTVLQLKQIQKGLDNILNKFATWEELHPGIKIGTIKLALKEALAQIQTRLPQVNWRSDLEELKGLTESVAVIEKAGEIYWITIQTAAGVITSDLGKFIEKLDAVEIPKQKDQLASYQSSLSKILEESPVTTLSVNENFNNPLFPDNLLIEKPEILIATMSLAKWVIIALVVFITGYTSFYANDFDFGTLTDYFKVFLWAIGLSVTGANILKSIKTPGASG